VIRKKFHPQTSMQTKGKNKQTNIMDFLSTKVLGNRIKIKHSRTTLVQEILKKKKLIPGPSDYNTMTA
jgi:hypothetical protein